MITRPKIAKMRSALRLWAHPSDCCWPPSGHVQCGAS